MSVKQRVVLIATAAVLIAMLLFPPFQSEMRQGLTLNQGYSFVLSPPMYDLVRSLYASQVNVSLLCLQFLIVVTVGGLLFFALKSAAKPAAPNPHRVTLIPVRSRRSRRLK